MGRNDLPEIIWATRNSPRVVGQALNIHGPLRKSKVVKLKHTPCLSENLLVTS